MMHYSISNAEQYNAVNADIQGSICSVIDKLFKQSHMVVVRTDGEKTFVTFEWVENGVLKRDTTWFDSKLFKEPNK